MNYTRTVSIAVFAAIAGSFQGVEAQTASTATNADKAGLDEVVITATKREQDIQDVAAAVTAVSGSALEDRGFSEASDLQFIVPNMQAGNSRGDTALTIRGVGFNQVGSPAVAIHVDGVYQPRPSMGDLGQTDIERVEVLRGPQGTLYGRNANGGVVNYITKAPTGEVGGYFRGSYASFNESRLEGAVNIPFSERVRARVLVDRWNRSDGFSENIAGGPDGNAGRTTSGRLRLSADLTDSLSFDLIASATKRTGSYFFTTTSVNPSSFNGAPPPFGHPDIYGPLGATWTGEPNKTTINDPTDSDRKASAYSGSFNWKLGDWSLKSISAYQRFHDDYHSDFDGSSASVYRGTTLSLSKTFTQEFDLSGAMGPVDSVIGVFYMDDDLAHTVEILQPNGDGGFPPNTLLHFATPSYKTKTKAVFADLTWNLSDRFRLIGGLRYSEDRQRAKQDDTILIAGLFPLPPATCTSDATLSLHSTTPRLGAQFDVSSDSNVYANYSKGFKVGGYNIDTGCAAVYLPERIKAYEVGWKNRVLDGAVTLNASAFFYDYTNLQLQQILGVSAIIINAPKAEVKGLELEAGWRPDMHWNIFANASLLNAKYTEFSNFDGAGANPFVPTDVKGNRLNAAPKSSLNVGGVYTTGPVIAGGALNFRADLSYRAKVSLREFNNPLDTQSSYSIVNAAVGWVSPDDRYTVRVFATNLTDKAYLTQMAFANPVGSRTISWGEPRQIGVELKAQF